MYEDRAVCAVFESVTYYTFERQNSSPHQRRCIDGHITGCGKCVGYCRYHEHPGYLTKDLRKQHNCIKKSCYYYVPKGKETPVLNPFSALSVLQR